MTEWESLTIEKYKKFILVSIILILMGIFTKYHRFITWGIGVFIGISLVYLIKEHELKKK